VRKMEAYSQDLGGAWHEPLRELARFAFDFAPHFCDPAHGCTAYHRGWSTVRLYESDGALPAGFAFFRQELLDLAGLRGTGRLRVMLSGAADTGQAALVLKALRPEGIEPEFVIVDRCRTTLEQHRLFFGLMGVTAEYVQADAVSVSVMPVDAILSHSFIGFIPESQRGALFANWNRLLAPGGRVLLSERFWPAGVEQRRPIDPAERAMRRDRLVARLEAEGAGAREIDEVVSASERLWDLSGKRRKMSDDEFRNSLRDVGLRVLREAADLGQHSVSPIAPNALSERYPRVEAVVVRAE
jgi:SAM-dependent methyltransferase